MLFGSIQAEIRVGNDTFNAPIFSKFIGNSSQFNCNVSGISSYLRLGEDLCLTSTIKSNLSGTVLFYPILTESNAQSIGCSMEQKYESAIAQGVIAMVSVSEDLEPGKGHFMHG